MKEAFKNWDLSSFNLVGMIDDGQIDKIEREKSRMASLNNHLPGPRRRRETLMDHNLRYSHQRHRQVRRRIVLMSTHPSMGA